MQGRACSCFWAQSDLLVRDPTSIFLARNILQMGNSGSNEPKGADGLDLPTGTKGMQECIPFCCSVSSKRPGQSSEIGIPKRKNAACLSLHRAAEHGILHEIEPNVKLWASSPDMINSADPHGDTALHKAARQDHLEMCKILCKVKRSTFAKYNFYA